MGSPSRGGLGWVAAPLLHALGRGAPVPAPQGGTGRGEMGAEKRVVLQEGGLSDEKQNGVAGGGVFYQPRLKNKLGGGGVTA